MKTFIKSILIFIIQTQASFANWPVFFIPDINYLLTNNIITSDNCPAGMAHISNVKFCKVNDLCKTYCPDTWSWKIEGRQGCFNLSAYALLNTTFDHINNENGETQYSIVTAYYGDESNTPLKLTFTTPNEHWFCVMQNDKLHAVTCANDI